MNGVESEEIIKEYLSFIETKAFPCIGAKAALAKRQITCLVVDHMACPKDDHAITKFIYDFVDKFRESNELYSSAAVIFKGPSVIDEDEFDIIFWQRLQ